MVSQSLSLPITMPTWGRPSRGAMSAHLPLRGARERALSDVPPVVHAGPADARDGGVRRRHRLLDRVAERGHAEHAPTVGHERAVGPLRPGVEDFATLPGAERLHALDPPPALDRARVALAGATIDWDARAAVCVVLAAEEIGRAHV